MAIYWSDDCLSCLCNLPHSLDAHHKAVERARAELQRELALLREQNRESGEDEERCICGQRPIAYSCLFSAEGEEEDRDFFCADCAQKYGYVFCGVPMHPLFT